MARTRKARLTIAEAATVVHMTTSGVYAAIKRGEISAKQVGGRRTVLRTELVAWRKHMDDLLKPKKQPHELTDAEFIQQMIDNDPD